MDDEQKPDPSLLKLAVYNPRKRTTSLAHPPGFPWKKVQPSVVAHSTLPTSPPKPQTQTGVLMIKDEPWKDHTEPSSAAQDWISPPNYSSFKIQTHSPPKEVLSNPSPDQGLKLLPKATIPTRPRSFFKRKLRDDEPPPSSPYTSKLQKSADNLVCFLCQVSCSSALTMQQHLKGRPHKAKMVYVKMKRGCTGSVPEPTCDLCGIWCSDMAALQMHFRGKKHKSKIQESQVCKERGGEKTSKAPIVCELCRVPCMNQDLLEMHLRGRQHATKEECKRRGFH